MMIKENRKKMTIKKRLWRGNKRKQKTDTEKTRKFMKEGMKESCKGGRQKGKAILNDKNEGRKREG